MRNPTPQDNPAAEAFRALIASGCVPRALEPNVIMLQQLRAASPESSLQMDRLLVDEIGRTRAGLESARSAQEAIKQTIEQITAPPYFPAIYLSPAGPEPSRNAMVRMGAELRAVGFGENDPVGFKPGDEVLLSHERNFIYGKSAASTFTCGETGAFVGYSREGRLVIKSRDEDLVFLAAAELRDTPLKAGDLLRFDRGTWVAYEKIDRPPCEGHFLEDTPVDSFASVGGLDREIARLKRGIEMYFLHPEAVNRYRLRPKKSVLLYGPPGTGKTLIARALANWLAGQSEGGRSRFINVKPAGLHSMWYGQSEANYREIFRVAREASSEKHINVVLFFDEVDSIAQERGRSVHQIDDKVANAFMAELNGLEERGNILVVTATNRLDTLDSAMTRPGRLGDLMLRIPRPGRKAVRQIFEKHLPCDIPYAAGGRSQEQARQESIDTAVSMLFSSDSDGELARIMFRDGKERVVRSGDLINGAGVASIAQSATEAACAREVDGGEGGVRAADLMSAVSDYLASAAAVLAPQNCRNYIDDLPQDTDVVRVNRVERKVSRPYRYINAA